MSKKKCKYIQKTEWDVDQDEALRESYEYMNSNGDSTNLEIDPEEYDDYYEDIEDYDFECAISNRLNEDELFKNPKELEDPNTLNSPKVEYSKKVEVKDESFSVFHPVIIKFNNFGYVRTLDIECHHTILNVNLDNLKEDEDCLFIHDSENYGDNDDDDEETSEKLAVFETLNCIIGRFYPSVILQEDKDLEKLESVADYNPHEFKFYGTHRKGFIMGYYIPESSYHELYEAIGYLKYKCKLSNFLSHLFIEANSHAFGLNVDADYRLNYLIEDTNIYTSRVSEKFIDLFLNHKDTVIDKNYMADEFDDVFNIRPFGYVNWEYEEAINKAAFGDLGLTTFKTEQPNPSIENKTPETIDNQNEVNDDTDDTFMSAMEEDYDIFDEGLTTEQEMGYTTGSKEVTKEDITKETMSFQKSTKKKVATPTQEDNSMVIARRN